MGNTVAPFFKIWIFQADILGSVTNVLEEHAASISILKMEAAFYCEPSVSAYKDICHKPEDINLNYYLSEHIKTYKKYSIH
jgi:hypothetical protein